MSNLSFEYFPYRLNFKYPFRLSHSERTGTDNVYLLVKDEESFGWGECVFIPYYSETLSTFENIVSNLKLPSDLSDIKLFIDSLKIIHPHSNFCLAAIDVAIHNLKASKTGVSITDQYGITGGIKKTSFTIGISTEQEMEKKLFENNEMDYYKLKVSQFEIERIVSTFTKLTDKHFTIDANQGFTDRNEALKWSYKLANQGVWYMEQPFHKDDFDSHAWLKAKSPIPILADESFQDYADLERIQQSFDGVNLKLMKCGGIAEGVACLKRVHEMGLKSIIGCMSESSVIINASKEIAPLADWVDLDGNLLITNDIFASQKSNEELIQILRSK